ncbi:MAG: hypothetical protein A4S09_11270 [Proteobacteria bacterium SG_bin7]|nr:MAG: hypothetical protein A4S09_11270 [Proteobacteria bacterium SG_bin7]
MKIFLAPMEGVTDFLIRQLFTEVGGYNQCTTEFVRVTNQIVPDSIFYKFCPELHSEGKTLSGVPVFLQLLGGNPEMMAVNAARAAALGAPGIDLNFGCPARTVNNHDGGAAILKNPHRVFDITSAVRAAVPPHIPVTVKMRLGFSHPEWAVEIAQAAETARCDRLTIHARTRQDGYLPPAHWNWLAKINLAVRVPLVANGEIWTREDYLRCYETCGIADVMIGRGAFIRPDLAWQICENRPPFTWSEIFSLVQKFISLAKNMGDGRYLRNRTKQWLRQMARIHPEASALFEVVKSIESHDEFVRASSAPLDSI